MNKILDFPHWAVVGKVAGVSLLLGMLYLLLRFGATSTFVAVLSALAALSVFAWCWKRPGDQEVSSEPRTTNCPECGSKVRLDNPIQSRLGLGIPLYRCADGCGNEFTLP